MADPDPNLRGPTSLPTCLLLTQLACYGIGQLLLSWIRSFLSNRFQYVKVDKSYSSILPVMSGVPQGSVLGPVLFILYVNDINVLAPVGVTIKLFADDTKLYTTLMPVIQLGGQAEHCKLPQWGLGRY